MSTYVREKVLRIPLENLHVTELSKSHCYDEIRKQLQINLGDMLAHAEVGKFQITGTELAWYLDYVIEHEWDACAGDFGKTRALSAREAEKFMPIFQKASPEIDMCLVRVVEYCWYNCCEAPDYYDVANDAFYKELI